MHDIFHLFLYRVFYTLPCDTYYDGFDPRKYSKTIIGN